MRATFRHGRAFYYEADCFDWLAERRARSIQGVVTDPPYGLVEYSAREMAHKRNGNRGGIWRLPPAFDGYQRLPVPRFTVLTERDLEYFLTYFTKWGRLLERTLVPGAHVLVASNPLLTYVLASALRDAGLERRGQIVRLMQTMRGGDRPKGAHEEFPDVTVIPRAMHEPWLLFRKPLEGRISDNLRKWSTGGLRRPDARQPFGDVIQSDRTRPRERAIAPHASLKPQAFLRQVVRAILPLGEGVVCDTFAGSGSTLAAAEVVGYRSIGIDSDPSNTEMARSAIPALIEYDPNGVGRGSGSRLSTAAAEGARRAPHEGDGVVQASPPKQGSGGRGGAPLPSHRNAGATMGS